MNFLSLLCIVGLVGTAVAIDDECPGLMPGQPRQMVAFMATKVQPGKQIAQKGDIVTLDMTNTNIGNAFDTKTSKFTCTVDGLYFFNYHVTIETGEPVITLKKNRDPVNSFYGPSSRTYMGGNSALLLLAVGDEVYLEVQDQATTFHANIHNYQYCSFSGYLL